jgi:hypothetical protein
MLLSGHTENVMSCIEGLGKEQRIMALNVDMLQKELQQV